MSIGTGISVGVSVGMGASVGVSVDVNVGVMEGVGVEVDVGIGVGVGRRKFRRIFLSAQMPPSPCMYRRRKIGPFGTSLRSQVKTFVGVCI